MDHADAVALIQAAVPESKQSLHWADLGSGSGTFTKALADLLPEGSSITAIDRELHTILSPNKNVTIRFVQADFQNIHSIPKQPDGVLMANALHYVKDQVDFLNRIKSHLHPGGRLIIVEYDTERANPWVPYPVSYPRLQGLVTKAGFHAVQKIGERNSIYRADKLYACLVLPAQN